MLANATFCSCCLASPALSIDPCLYLCGNMSVGQDNDLQFKQHLFQQSIFCTVAWQNCSTQFAVYSAALIIIGWTSVRQVVLLCNGIYMQRADHRQQACRAVKRRSRVDAAVAW